MSGSRKGVILTPFLLGVLIIVLLLVRFRERWLRALLRYLSTAAWAQQLVTRNPIARRVAARFVAGESADEAIAAAAQVNAAGMSVTLNYLGEHVHSAVEADAARAEIARLLEKIGRSGVNAGVSIKPSQLGLHVEQEMLYENLHQLLDTARNHGVRVRIDMEESSTVDKTLAVYRRLRDDDGYGRHVGIVIQAYLYRSETDIKTLAANGAWIRLCKGAYAEPPDIAFPLKHDTDASFLRLARTLLSTEARAQGTTAGFATHDDNMIQGVRAFAAAHQIEPHAYEFQMLHGVRRELQEALVADGFQVRVYIPYGEAWYPYFVRRLAERPANLWFFLSNLLRS